MNSKERMYLLVLANRFLSRIFRPVNRFLGRILRPIR
jgi:hypothetical protein